MCGLFRIKCYKIKDEKREKIINLLEAKLWRIKCLNNNMAEEFTMRNDDVGGNRFVELQSFMIFYVLR